MNSLWCDLQVGDKIRLTHMPEEFSQPGCYLHEDTRRVYEHLIAEQAVLTVTELDEMNMPWTEYCWVDDDGRKEYHSLLVNHGGLERLA